MLELFNNPGYAAAGGALVSAPVIIHLINRMRFRRIRWAAMEFLLKSQKRNRRRLIIEQLLLLMLRCLLVFLTAMLVLRFVGFTLAGYSGQDGLHLIVLDDTLSMTDHDPQKKGGDKVDCFHVAKKTVILENILNKAGQSTTNERLTIIPLSKLVQEPDYRPVIYQKLGERATVKEIEAELEKLESTSMHVDLAAGLERAGQIIEDLLDEGAALKPMVHVVSDFRLRDWSGGRAEKLKKALEKLAAKEAKLFLLDTAYPQREDQGGVPPSNDNVAIVDFRANTRLVGKKMPVTFTVTVANHSPSDKNVNVVIYRYETERGADGKEVITVKEQLDLNFNPTMPFNVPANSTASAQFDYRPRSDVKEGAEFHSERFAVHLETTHRTALEDDGVLGDNIRYASVQIRNKIPILLIEGDGMYGEATYWVERGIAPISSSYQIFYGDRVSGSSDSTKVLESPDLLKYAAIYLLNVPKLSEQLKGQPEDLTKIENLESYVNDGGSVAFFLGPKTQPKHYTEKLHQGLLFSVDSPIQADLDELDKGVLTDSLKALFKVKGHPLSAQAFGEVVIAGRRWQISDAGKDYDLNLVAAKLHVSQKGKGVFPVPLEDKIAYHPDVDPSKPANQNRLLGSGLLLRDDLRDLKDIPIFNKMIANQKQYEYLQKVAVIRHFVVPRDRWEKTPGSDFELVALPNKKSIGLAGLDARVGKVIEKIDKLVADNPQYGRYENRLREYKLQIGRIIFDAKAYQLGLLLDGMLNDGSDSKEKTGTRLAQFWSLPDPQIADLRKEIKDIAEKAIYGDPFIVSRQYGKGRVVAVMSAPGKGWNDWGEGIAAHLWPLFQKYTLNYLFDQTSETSLRVGEPYQIQVNVKKFQKDGKQQLKIIRSYYESKVNEKVKFHKIEEPGSVDGDIQTFVFTRNFEPGFYVSELVYQDSATPTSLKTWEHVVNIDTDAESNLQRASPKEMEDNVLAEHYQGTGPRGPGSAPPVINRQSDMSESPFFFLLFLVVLITEQALAVHLSFHLKGSQAQMPAQAVTSQAPAQAA